MSRVLLGASHAPMEREDHRAVFSPPVFSLARITRSLRGYNNLSYTAVCRLLGYVVVSVVFIVCIGASYECCVGRRQYFLFLCWRHREK